MSSKAYTFTRNNYTDEEVAKFSEFTDSKLTHLYVAKEVAPKTGTPHLQGYVCFSSNITIKKLHKKSFIFKHCALLESAGSPAQNRNYCFKGEQPKEEWEEQGVDGPNYGLNVQKVADINLSKQGGRTDLKEFKDAVLSGATQMYLVENYFVEMQKYGRFYEKLRKIYLKLREYPPGQPSRKREVKVEIHWGAPGAGKSHVGHVCGAISLDLASKGWFDGYDDEATVILEEFDWTKFDIDFFKKLIDCYPVQLNIKGTSGYANWTRVIITSNNDPSGWWPNASKVDRDAFFDRVSLIRYYAQKSKYSKRKACVYEEVDSSGDVKHIKTV